MKQDTKINGYWFAASDTLPHGDRRKVIIGKTHRKRGEIVICHRGFHCSSDAFDALKYAPGSMLYKVQIWGDVQSQDDKHCGRNRTYLAVRDASDMLRLFARRQALSAQPGAQPGAQPRAQTDWSAARSAAQSADWSAARSAARQMFGEMVVQLFEDN